MAATLQRVEELRRALVEDVAHELRTPLTTLRGYTEALAEGIVQPTPEMLRTVHQDIERLTRLVDALDALARDEARARQQALAEVRLGEVVRRSLALAGPALRARDISVSIEEPGGLPALQADPDGIGQVVSNLVQNAVEYTTDGGEIVVRLTVDGAACDARSPTPARTSRPSSCP